MRIMTHRFRLRPCGLTSGRLLIILIIAVVSGFKHSAAQTGTPVTFLKNNIRLTGQASTYGEVYTAKGITGRRPPSTLRLSLSPSLIFSKYFSLSTNILLSTEGSEARQNINIFGLHPVWKWGRAHAGDFSDMFSRYSFNGVNVTGAELDLYPGKLRFTLGGGRTKRAVQGILVHESYDQSLVAARIGYGKQTESHIHLFAVRAADDPSSLKKPEDWDYDYVNPDTLETDLDTLWVEPPYNPLSVTPQENLIIGFATQLNLFQNKLVWEIEGNGSGYTKDLNAAKVNIDSIDASSYIKQAFNSLFTPRAGTNFDMAVNSAMQVRLKNFNLKAGYRYIGAGYYSLGIPSTVNDRQELLLNAGMRAGPNRVRVQWSRLNDNLLKQKIQTNIRNQFQASVHTITTLWQSQVSLRFLGMNNDAAADSMEWSFNNLVLSTNQSIRFKSDAVVRQIGIQYTFQTSDKQMPEQVNKATYHTLTLTSLMRIARVLRINGSAGLSYRNSNTTEAYTTQVYSLRMNHTALKNRLNTSVFSSSSMVRDTRMFRTGITTVYRLSKNYRITGNVSYNNFSGTRKYKELRSSVMLTRQF